MEEALLFIESYQRWIYLALLLMSVIYARMTLRAWRNFRASVFELERERAASRLARSGAGLAVLAALLIAVFILVTFASPALPASMRPTPVPTISLLATPEAGQPETAGGSASPVPLEPLASGGAGCENPLAPIQSPADGERVSGAVSFLGAADVPSFAFYKIEYNDLSPEGTWLAITASTSPVCEGTCTEAELLGTWDTTLVTPGDYAVRLVVTDTQGNAPLPCEILLSVAP